ncbi:hypothetical protein EGW08_017607, partial [Elysia chlorotica]
MCGKTVDMNWLADRGLQVVGLDIALEALVQFMTDSGHNWSAQAAPKLGPTAKLFTRDDGKIKLYCGDAFNFSSALEGQFDAIYDCDGFHSFTGSLFQNMANVMKEVLAPGGRFLLDAVNYDPKMLERDDLNIEAAIPPPYPVTVEAMRNAFEPECEVELLETHIETKVFCLTETPFNAYLVKKQE